MNVMLISYGLSQIIWGEAIITSNYILNIVPHKKSDKISYELFKGRRSTYNYLQKWRCRVKMVLPPPKKEKIDLKTVDYVFINYA